jgi:hypothetical protein
MVVNSWSGTGNVTWSVSRAQDGTGATPGSVGYAHSNLAIVENDVTATYITNINTQATGHVHTGADQSASIFSATAPATQNFGDTAAAGSSTVAARQGHIHGMPLYPSFNALINGDFAFAQTGFTSNQLVNGQYNLDNWMWAQVGNGVLYQTRIDGAAASILGNMSLSTYSYVNVVTARTTSAAGDVYILQQGIEGWDARHLINGCTFSGWFYSPSNAGTYCIALRNRGSTVSYVHPFTLSAGTWAYVTFTVPALTSVTGDFRTQVGMFFSICFAAGSNFQTTADAWNTGNYVATSAQTNFAATASASLYMHALNLIPGPYAQPFVPLPYQQELARVMRYRQVLGADGTDYVAICQAYAGTSAQYSRGRTVLMLGTPTLTVTNMGNFALLSAGGGAAYPVTSVGDTSTLNTIRGAVTASTGALVAGNASLLYLSATPGSWVYESYPA